MFTAAVADNGIFHFVDLWFPCLCNGAGLERYARSGERFGTSVR